MVGDQYEIVGATTTLADLEERVDELSPDLLITDLIFGREGGALAVIASGRTSGTIRCPFIVITMHESRAHINEVYNSGAAGYLTKSATEEELLDAIEVVMRGDRVFPWEMISDLPRELIPNRYKVSKLVDIDGLLFNRREVVVMLGLHRGASRVQIGRELEIAHRTVSAYLTDIRLRLGISSNRTLLQWVEAHIDELRQIHDEETS